MEMEPRSLICPKCQSEEVVFLPNPEADLCPGDCEDPDPLRLQPDCCVGDRCVTLICNACGQEW